MHISYELDSSSKDLNTDFTLGNCSFVAVKLTKNADPDIYNILAMTLDLILVHNFHGQMEAWEKM